MIEDEVIGQESSGASDVPTNYVDPADMSKPQNQSGGKQETSLTPEESALIQQSMDSLEEGGEIGNEEGDSDKGKITPPTEKITVDPLATLWDDEEQTIAPGPSTEELQQQAEAIQKDITDAVASYHFDEKLIPEDFNPSDPQQLRDVLESSQRHAIAETMKMVFRPITRIMQDSEGQMQRIVQAALMQERGSTQTKTLLEQAIPIANDPQMGGVVKSVFNQAMKKTGNPKAAIALTKAMLTKMNVNIKGHQLPRNQDSINRQGERVQTRRPSMAEFIGSPLPEATGQQKAQNYLRKS